MTIHINEELYKALPTEVSPAIVPSAAITTDNLKRSKEIKPVKNIPEAM